MTQLLQNLSQQCQGVYHTILYLFEPEVRWDFGLWQTQLRKQQRQQQHCCQCQQTIGYISFRERTEEVALRTTTHVVSVMIHLMAVSFGTC